MDTKEKLKIKEEMELKKMFETKTILKLIIKLAERILPDTKETKEFIKEVSDLLK